MTSHRATIGIGDRVGDLLVERRLGQGRFGVVYLARDIALGRRVALKVVATPSEDERRAVADEARLVAQLQNPHIVTLFRASPHNEGSEWLLEMEYVDGNPLEDLLEGSTPLPRDRTHAILAGLVEAVCAAHDHGVVHGDIKPANVLLARDGRAKLADFGLARLQADVSLDDVISESTAGTPLFMAPEILLGVGAGPPADVWSIGVVLYRMLTGNCPFPTTSAADLFHAVANLPPLPFPSGGDPLLQRIALACLTKEPERRPCATVLRRCLEEREAVALAEPGSRAPSGRSREVGRLRAAVAEAQTGQAKGVLLVGEAGVGKTYLLESLRHECEVEGLRWIGIAAGTGGLLADRLGDRLDLGPAETESAAHSIARALTSMATQTPAVVAVDDIDETGPDERRLLSHLLRHLGHARVLLVASARSREALPGFELVELDPLDAADMTALLERELGHPLDAASARWLVEKAEGRPLFAVEFLRQLEAEGLVRVDSGQARVTRFDVAPPVRIRDLVARQLAGLPEEEREVLEIAAVDGTVFDGQALAAATGRRSLEVLRTLQRLCRERALVLPDTDGFRFRSSYLRDAVYDRLAPELRRRLHEVLARHLEARGIADSERLGRHWEGAGDAERARRCYAQAALDAVRRHEPHRTIRLAERAGIVPGGVDGETALANHELMPALAAQYVASGRLKEADQLYDALLDAARDAGNEQLYLAAVAWRARSRFMEAGAAGVQLDELRRATKELPPGEPHAMAHYVLGVFARNRGDLAQARVLLEQADRLYDEAGLAGHRSTAKNLLASLAMREGRLREADRLYAEAAEIDWRFGRFWLAAVTELNRLAVAFRSGRLQGTAAAMERHARALLADGLPDLAAHARALVAGVRWAEGDGQGALRDTDMAMSELAETGHRIGLVDACQMRTELAFASGRLDTMSEAIAAGVEHARKLADISGETILLGHDALRMACCGDVDAAWERIGEALAAGADSTDSQGIGTLAGVCAEAALLAASPRIVADVATRVRAHTGGFFVRPAEAALAAVSAWHERQPVPLFDAATALRSEEIGPRRAVLRTLALLFEGRAYEVAGEPASARKSFQQALAAARALGHVWYQAIALQRLGGSVDNVLAQVRPSLSARARAHWRRGS